MNTEQVGLAAQDVLEMLTAWTAIEDAVRADDPAASAETVYQRASALMATALGLPIAQGGAS